MTADLPDWMPESQAMLSAYLAVSTQIAALIATGSPIGTAGGVPLLNMFTAGGQDLLQNLAGGASVNIGIGSPNQPTVEGYLQLANQGAANTVACPVCVRIRWQSAAGIDLGVDTFWAYAGQQGSDHYIYFRGPNEASAGVMTIINGNAVAGNSIIFSLHTYNSSRIFRKFSAISGSWNAAPYTQFGATAFPTALPGNAPSQPETGTLIEVSVSIPAGTTQQYLLPLLHGPAVMQASSASSTNDMQLTILPVSNALLGGAAEIVNLKTDATGIIAPMQFLMPPVQSQLNLRNTNAAAKVVDCVIVVDRE